MATSPFAQLAAWLITVGYALPTPATFQPGDIFELHPIEERIVAETNTERIRYGLRPLAVDAALIKSARAHATWMTRSRSLHHTAAMVAENIAMGQRSAAEVVRDWMSSPGHRANILRSSHRRLGVAAYVTPEGTIYWCQQFLP
jgi:uncharacterized protein YkwD